MADDPSFKLRAELNTALDKIRIQIEGLDDLFVAGFSSDRILIIDEARSVRQTRRRLIEDVLSALDVVEGKLILLEDDGYPIPPPNVNIPSSFFTELRREQDAFTAAIAIFIPPVPVAIKLDVDSVVHTPQIEPTV